MSEKCYLGKKYHKEVKDIRQVDAITTCPLFGRDVYLIENGTKKLVSMGGTPNICVYCCLQVHKILEIRRDLIMKKTISTADERQNADMVIQFLDKELVPFAEAMLKKGSFAESEGECHRCNARTWASVPRSAPPIKPNQATEMNYVGIRGRQAPTMPGEVGTDGKVK